jgi:hypothetical protein
MTFYSYECPKHGEFQRSMPFGHASKGVYHKLGQVGDTEHCDLWSPRMYGQAGLQFTYGKEDFHGPTIGERLEADRKEWDEAGIKAEPVGQRWI